MPCTCSNGYWQCLGPRGDCPYPAPTVCPTPRDVENNVFCFVAPGVSCEARFGNMDCNDQVVSNIYCSCVNGAWACPAPIIPVCIDAGPPPCPPPDAGPCPAPTACPEPNEYLVGVPYAPPCAQCPGDPTYCDGAVFYDALQCEWDGSTWRWQAIATTVCPLDSGPDVSVAVDGGAWDAESSLPDE
jgi:hypothetical protein